MSKKNNAKPAIAVAIPNVKETLYGMIATVGASEGSTRSQLKEFSRKALIYVPQSGDVEVVNRMINVLTPHNKAKMIAYFKHFLPWKSEQNPEKVHIRFGEKSKEYVVAKKMVLIGEFMAVEANDFWSWSDPEASEKKAKNHAELLRKAVQKAAKGDELTVPLTHSEILAAVFSGSNFSIDDMLQAVEDQKVKADAAKAGVAEVQPMAEAA